MTSSRSKEYGRLVIEVAWLTEEQIGSMTSDFKLVAKFFRDKRLGTDMVFKDSTKIVHVDDLLFIPFDEYGALETYLLNCIRKSDAYDKVIIDKGCSGCWQRRKTDIWLSP